MNIQKYTYGILLFIATVFILYMGKILLMPLVLAIIAWFIIKEILYNLDKIKIKGESMPSYVQKIMAFAFVVGVLFILSTILMKSINGIQAKMPIYEENLDVFIAVADLPVKLDYKVWIDKFNEKFDLTNILTIAVNSVSVILSNIVLILLYLFFLLLEEKSFKRKIAKLYPPDNEGNNLEYILRTINKSMSNYIGLKTLTSALTGLLSFGVLLVVGVDFPFFWAFLIFLLNYIPNIGSMVATLFPVIIAFLQFGTWEHPAVILVSVGSIQILVGNILEPKVMGNSLNVSPLVVLISLAFWGWLWGVIGMIISVPIAIMIIIFCAQFNNLRWISVLLSTNGNLPTENKNVKI